MSPERSLKPASGTSPGMAYWLLVVLAVPRIVRLLYPEVWVEDDFYLESAYLVSAGMRPYRDFIHPHMPLLELAVGEYLKLFGANYFSIELLNETAIFLTSVLTFRLASRIGSQFGASCAAILYSFSSLVFRYHVYERECFVAPLVMGAVLAATDEALGTARQAIWQVTLFVIAASIKLTALIECAVVLLYLMLRRWTAAIVCGLGVLLGLMALTGLFYWLYGFEFVFQTFVFHFMKGRDSTAHLGAYPAQILDVLAPLFVLGCVHLAILRRVSREASLMLGLVASGYIFFGWLSPTAWGHNYLDFLPFIAIVAGLGLERLLRASSRSFRAPAAVELAWAGGGWLFVAASLLTVTPLVNENWLRGSVYGFGFVPRGEIAQLNGTLTAPTTAAPAIIAPAFICFAANRRELITYPETYGVYREAEKEFERSGFRGARAALGSRDFFDLIVATAHYWSDEMAAAVADGSVDAIIPDSAIEVLPIVRPPLAPVSRNFLLAHDLRPEMRTEHFVLWKRVRPPAQGTP